jgi:hypothetical protein
MSEPEAFLTRWSRRKREADEAAPETRPIASEEHAPAKPPDQDQVSEPSAVEPKATAAKPPEAKPPEAKPPEVDLSALPSLESISATTDIRPFLQPGVPAELTRAALRRAWVADPAIRDFVGLAENAWDFTAPDTVPGFGSSVPADVARRLLAGMFGPDESAPATEAVPQSATTTKPNVAGATGEAGVEASALPEAPAKDDAGRAPDNHTIDVAMHKEEAPSEPPKPGRAHGGALPR